MENKTKKSEQGVRDEAKGRRNCVDEIEDDIW